MFSASALELVHIQLAFQHRGKSDSLSPSHPDHGKPPHRCKAHPQTGDAQQEVNLSLTLPGSPMKAPLEDLCLCFFHNVVGRLHRRHAPGSHFEIEICQNVLDISWSLWPCVYAR